ncbi:MAG: ammonium transporter [Spirochaetia bacterium]|nr:ammonium transporter [Spirochaetia bacterium]
MRKNWLPFSLLLLCSLSSSLWAESPPLDAAGLKQLIDESKSAMTVGADTVWVLITAALVFFMNTGFGLLEAGLNRAKNAVNILAKNFVVFAIASVSFYLIGWGLMFGNGNSFMGLEGLFGLTGADNSPAIGDAYKGVYSAINWTGVPLEAKFFFQLVFAGTAATIVSGAVAERIKFYSFVVFSIVLVGIMYPITGHWIWGGGFLASKGMFDFAGSTVVHSVGGWAALTGAYILGPRRGKYTSSGINPIPGHNMGMAFTGCFVLWLGWFGFNPGSTMGVGDGKLISHIFNTTNLAAAAGCLGAAITATLIMKKPDFSMILNGCLAGLVAITAPCAWVTLPASLIIGFVAGILVVLAVPLFDKLKIDDPVGATSVHLVNGIWGTLCVGLFASAEWGAGGTAAPAVGLFNGGGFGQTWSQLIGIGAVAFFTLVISAIIWFALKFTMGLRVSEEEENIGLDIGEHGNNAYPDFQSVTGHK